MNAVIYARYSSENQSEESITAQLRACRDYARHNKMVVVGEYIDRAQSARSDKRTDFQRMIADSKKHLFDVVIVHKLDRFSRDRYDHAYYRRELRNAKVQLRSVLENLDDSPESVVLESVLEGFSEYYSKNLARETRKGLRETALEARYTGGNVLYGYYVGEDQKYHINEEEAVVVRKIFDCCESQCGYGGLLEELRNKGIHTRQGRVFTASTFYYILKNRRYTGDYVYSPVGNLKEHRSQPIIVENAIPAIVSKPQWEKVQAILHKRQTKGMVTAREPYLLSGLLFCGECGSPMSGHRSRKKKNGGEYVYYSYECQAKVRKHACKKRCVPRDEIETKILDYVKILFSQQSVAYIQNYIQTHANELNLDILTQQEQLRKSAEKLDRKIDNTIELLIDSPSDRLREKLDELEAQRRKIDYQIDELNTHKIDSDMLKDYIVEVRSLENMSRLELQPIIRKIIKKVTIYEDGHFDGFSVFYTENGGATQNRTGDQGVAVHCLTAWLWHRMERMTRLELATSTLARWRSTR